MPVYTPPTVTVNQLGPQQLIANGPTGKTILLLGTAPQGPDYPMLLDRSQVIALFGDPTSPASSGYTLPLGLLFAGIQQQPARNTAVRFLVCRAGVTRATGTLQDAASATALTISGIGAYAGSRGANLQVVVSAPQVAIARTQYGNAAQNEVQTITLYAVGGSPTGTYTLSFAGQTTAGIAPTATAAAVQTALTGLSTIGAGNATVTGAAGGPYTVTFTGTLANKPQALLTAVSAITGGTGAIPVASITLQDISSGTPVARQVISGSQYDLTSNAKIAAAINGANQLGSPAAIAQAQVGGSTNLPRTQTVTLSGGADGLGAAATDATIAPLLAQSLSQGADYVWAGWDAAAILPAVYSHLQSAIAVGQYRKAVLGPAAGTTFATLTGAYQQANSDRVVMVGHDTAYGTNPINGLLNAGFDGFYLAAALVGLKAIGPSEENLVDFPIAGFTDVAIAPDKTGPLLPADLNALAGAGYTVLYRNPVAGRLLVRDALTTTPFTTASGQTNPLAYFAVRDADDQVAKRLLAAMGGAKGRPAGNPYAVQALLQSVAANVLASMQGREVNGAQVAVAYDPVSNAATVTVVYADRPPQNTIVINVAFNPTLSNTQ